MQAPTQIKKYAVVLTNRFGSTETLEFTEKREALDYFHSAKVNTRSSNLFEFTSKKLTTI